MGMQASEVFLFNLSNTRSKIYFICYFYSNASHVSFCCCCCCCCVCIDWVGGWVGGFSINLYNKQWEEKIEEASLFVCLFVCGKRISCEALMSLLRRKDLLHKMWYQK